MTLRQHRPELLDINRISQHNDKDDDGDDDDGDDDDDDRTPEYPLKDDHPFALLTRKRLDMLSHDNNITCPSFPLSPQTHSQVESHLETWKSTQSPHDLKIKLARHTHPDSNHNDVPHHFGSAPDDTDSEFVIKTETSNNSASSGRPRQDLSSTFPALDLDDMSKRDCTVTDRLCEKDPKTLFVRSPVDTPISVALSNNSTKKENLVFSSNVNEIMFVDILKDNNNNAGQKDFPFQLNVCASISLEEHHRHGSLESADIKPAPEELANEMGEVDVENIEFDGDDQYDGGYDHFDDVDAEEEEDADDDNSKSPPHLSPMDENISNNFPRTCSTDHPLPPTLSPITSNRCFLLNEPIVPKISQVPLFKNPTKADICTKSVQTLPGPGGECISSSHKASGTMPSVNPLMRPSMPKLENMHLKEFTKDTPNDVPLLNIPSSDNKKGLKNEKWIMNMEVVMTASENQGPSIDSRSLRPRKHNSTEKRQIHTQKPRNTDSMLTVVKRGNNAMEVSNGSRSTKKSMQSNTDSRHSAVNRGNNLMKVSNGNRSSRATNNSWSAALSLSEMEDSESLMSRRLDTTPNHHSNEKCVSKPLTKNSEHKHINEEIEIKVMAPRSSPNKDCTISSSEKSDAENVNTGESLSMNVTESEHIPSDTFNDKTCKIMSESTNCSPYSYEENGKVTTSVYSSKNASLSRTSRTLQKSNEIKIVLTDCRKAGTVTSYPSLPVQEAAHASCSRTQPKAKAPSPTTITCSFDADKYIDVTSTPYPVSKGESDSSKACQKPDLKKESTCSVLDSEISNKDNCKIYVSLPESNEITSVNTDTFLHEKIRFTIACPLSIAATPSIFSHKETKEAQKTCLHQISYSTTVTEALNPKSTRCYPYTLSKSHQSKNYFPNVNIKQPNEIISTTVDLNSLSNVSTADISTASLQLTHSPPLPLETSLLKITNKEGLDMHSKHNVSSASTQMAHTLTSYSNHQKWDTTDISSTIIISSASLTTVCSLSSVSSRPTSSITSKMSTQIPISSTLKAVSNGKMRSGHEPTSETLQSKQQTPPPSNTQWCDQLQSLSTVDVSPRVQSSSPLIPYSNNATGHPVRYTMKYSRSLSYPSNINSSSWHSSHHSKCSEKILHQKAEDASRENLDNRTIVSQVNNSFKERRESPVVSNNKFSTNVEMDARNTRTLPCKSSSKPIHSSSSQQPAIKPLDLTKKNTYHHDSPRNGSSPTHNVFVHDCLNTTSHQSSSQHNQNFQAPSTFNSSKAEISARSLSSGEGSSKIIISKDHQPDSQLTVQITQQRSPDMSDLSPGEDNELLSFMSTYISSSNNQAKPYTPQEEGGSIMTTSGVGENEIDMLSGALSDEMQETQLAAAVTKTESPVFINERNTLTVVESDDDGNSSDGSTRSALTPNKQSAELPLKDFFTQKPTDKTYSSLARALIEHKNRKSQQNLTSRKTSDTEDILNFLTEKETGLTCLPDTDPWSGVGKNLLNNEIIDLTYDDVVSISSDEEEANVDDGIDEHAPSDVSGRKIETVESQVHASHGEEKTENDSPILDDSSHLLNPILAESLTALKKQALKMSGEKRAELSARIQSIMVRRSGQLPESLRNSMLTGHIEYVTPQPNGGTEDGKITQICESSSPQSITKVENISPQHTESTGNAFPKTVVSLHQIWNEEQLSRQHGENHGKILENVGNHECLSPKEIEYLEQLSKAKKNHEDFSQNMTVPCKEVPQFAPEPEKCGFPLTQLTESSANSDIVNNFPKHAFSSAKNSFPDGRFLSNVRNEVPKFTPDTIVTLPPHRMTSDVNPIQHPATLPDANIRRSLDKPAGPDYGHSQAVNISRKPESGLYRTVWQSQFDERTGFTHFDTVSRSPVPQEQSTKSNDDGENDHRLLQKLELMKSASKVMSFNVPGTSTPAERGQGYMMEQTPQLGRPEHLDSVQNENVEPINLSRSKHDSDRDQKSRETHHNNPLQSRVQQTVSPFSFRMDEKPIVGSKHQISPHSNTAQQPNNLRGKSNECAKTSMKEQNKLQSVPPLQHHSTEDRPKSIPNPRMDLPSVSVSPLYINPQHNPTLRNRNTESTTVPRSGLFHTSYTQNYIPESRHLASNAINGNIVYVRPQLKHTLEIQQPNQTAAITTKQNLVPHQIHGYNTGFLPPPFIRGHTNLPQNPIPVSSHHAGVNFVFVPHNVPLKIQENSVGFSNNISFNHHKSENGPGTHPARFPMTSSIPTSAPGFHLTALPIPHSLPVNAHPTNPKAFHRGVPAPQHAANDSNNLYPPIAAYPVHLPPVPSSGQFASSRFAPAFHSYQPTPCHTSYHPSTYESEENTGGGPVRIKQKERPRNTGYKPRNRKVKKDTTLLANSVNDSTSSIPEVTETFTIRPVHEQFVTNSISPTDNEPTPNYGMEHKDDVRRDEDIYNQEIKNVTKNRKRKKSQVKKPRAKRQKKTIILMPTTENENVTSTISFPSPIPVDVYGNENSEFVPAPVETRSDSGFSDSGAIVDQRPGVSNNNEYRVEDYVENGIALVSLKPLLDQTECTLNNSTNDETCQLKQKTDSLANDLSKDIISESNPGENVKGDVMNGLSSLFLASQKIESDMNSDASPQNYERDRTQPIVVNLGHTPGLIINERAIINSQECGDPKTGGNLVQIPTKRTKKNYSNKRKHFTYGHLVTEDEKQVATLLASLLHTPSLNER